MKTFIIAPGLFHPLCAIVTMSFLKNTKNMWENLKEQNNLFLENSKLLKTFLNIFFDQKHIFNVRCEFILMYLPWLRVSLPKVRVPTILKGLIASSSTSNYSSIFLVWNGPTYYWRKCQGSKQVQGQQSVNNNSFW